MKKVLITVTLETDRDSNELVDMLIDGRIDHAGKNVSIKVMGPTGTESLVLED